MTQPYRQGEIRPLCLVCGEIADGGCLRCGRPLCEEHEHGETDRCPRCERSFLRRVNFGVTSLSLAAQLTVGPLYVLTGWPSVDAGRWRQRFLDAARARFLRQRKAKKK